MQNGTHATGNGVRVDAAIAGEYELAWDGLPPAVTQALGQPLDPQLVSQRRGRGGASYDYLEGHTAIAQANEVFGFGGWGYDLLDGPALREIEHADPRTGEARRIRAYAAAVRVVVPGVPPRTDVGFHAVAEESAEGHETAYKGAVTDALKRALRTFGDRFGNGLYGGRPTPAGGAARPERAPDRAARSGAPARESAQTERPDGAEAERLRRRLVELGVEQGFDEAGVRAAVRRQTGRDLDELDAEEAGRLVESAALKVQRMREAQAA